MTFEDIQQQIEELPSDDPEFIIGWLIAQFVYVTEELEKSKKKYDA